MTEILKLNAVLRFHESNFLNLHWDSAGIDFNDSHKDITTGYYEMCNSYIDVTAEMAARLGEYPYNFMEVADEAKRENWTVVKSDKLYERPEIVNMSQKLLGEIMDCVNTCLKASEMNKTENAGIRSELEAIQEAFDIEYRYINKRRSGR